MRFVPRDHCFEQIGVGTDVEYPLEQLSCSNAFGVGAPADLGARLGVDPNSGCGAGSHDSEHRCNQ